MLTDWGYTTVTVKSNSTNVLCGTSIGVRLCLYCVAHRVWDVKRQVAAMETSVEKSSDILFSQIAMNKLVLEQNDVIYNPLVVSCSGNIEGEKTIECSITNYLMFIRF
jgi:hypothetical protein